MEVIRLGEINPNALEEDVVIQPLNCAINVANNSVNNYACLKRLDYLLAYISSDNQDLIGNYVANLKTKLTSLLKDDSLADIKSTLSPILKTTKYLHNYPELAKITLAYNLQLLEMSKDRKWEKENITVKNGNYIRSYLIPNYYFLDVLIETIGKERAISLYKRYLSSFLAIVATQTSSNFTTLKENFDSSKKAVNTPSDWVIVIGLTSEGKYIYRNDNCLWIDALEDLPDKEIKYYTCCYGDYQIANSRSNGHVILTMEHTLAEGDPYCSRAKHDTRYDWNLKHPKKEVYDKLWALPK